MVGNPIPEGYPAVCPNLVVLAADRLLVFLRVAFGASERVRHLADDGLIDHAEVQIRESVLFVSEARSPEQVTRASLHLYVEDVDATYERAIAAGASAENPPANQFWGDRTVDLLDPAGNRWWVSTHVEDVPPDELARRAEMA